MLGTNKAYHLNHLIYSSQESCWRETIFIVALQMKKPMAREVQFHEQRVRNGSRIRAQEVLFQCFLFIEE